MKEIIKKLQEAGNIHSEKCPMNSHGRCCFISNIDCCDNIRFIASLIKDTIEFMSHDMKFDNEEQRIGAVKMYYKSLED
jgi:hypothetical protein